MSSYLGSKVLRPDVKISLTTEEQKLFDLLLKANDYAQCKSTLRVAGGWVRDKILGRDSHDIDIAIDNMTGYDFAVRIEPFLLEKGGDPSHIGRIKANPEKSKHLETTRLMVNNIWIDLVNLRAEEYTESSRIPTITVGTPKEDAYRRDLTINSMFYNLNIQTIEDFTEKGIDDLRSHIIRTPLSPLVTFLDDPLRILRCIRFTARFNFKIDPLIEQEGKDPRIRDALITKVSDERKGIEIATAFSYSSQSALLCIQYLYSFHLLSVLFPCYNTITKPIDKRLNDLDVDSLNPKKCLTRFYSNEELVPIFKDVDLSKKIGEEGCIYNKDGLYDFYYKEGTNKIQFIQNLRSQLSDVANALEPHKHFQESIDDSATYLDYASFFSVFSFLFVPLSNMNIPLINFYLRDVLKFKIILSGHITVLCHLSPILSDMMFTKKTFDVITVGTYISFLKDLWPLAFEFSLYDYIYTNKDNIDIPSICSQFISFIKQIESHSLSSIWTLPLPLDGKDIALMGFKRGPTLKYPIQFVQKWHFCHPYGDPNECKEELKHYMKLNPQFT